MYTYDMILFFCRVFQVFVFFYRSDCCGAQAYLLDFRRLCWFGCGLLAACSYNAWYCKHLCILSVCIFSLLVKGRVCVGYVEAQIKLCASSIDILRVYIADEISSSGSSRRRTRHRSCGILCRGPHRVRYTHNDRSLILLARGYFPTDKEEERCTTADGVHIHLSFFFFLRSCLKGTREQGKAK
ncbi:unnamed protein product, partial [Pylaiella littoralis]